MTLKMTATVGMFGVVDGNVQNEAPNLLAARAPVSASDKGSGQLYVAAEIMNHPLSEEQLYSEVLQSISDAYYRLPGSSTARLQEAMREANALLLHTNSGLPRAEWLLGGASCVVMAGEDVYVAQAGPCAVYVAQRGELRRYPEISQWLQEEDARTTGLALPAALGSRPGIQPDLLHFLVQPGDTVVLMTTGLAQAIPAPALAGAAAETEIGNMLYSLARLAHDVDGACMVIRVQALVTEPQTAPTDALAEQPVDRHRLHPETAPASERYPTGAPPDVSKPPSAGRETAMPRDRTSERAKPSEDEDSARLWELPPQRPERPGRGVSRRGSAAGEALASASRAVHDALALIPLGAATIWRAVTGSRRSVRQPTRRTGPRLRRWVGGRTINRLWLVPLVLIPAVALVVIGASWRQAQVLSQQVASLVKQAEESAVVAGSSADPAVKRSALAQALDLLSQALALRQTDPKASSAQAQVLSSLDQLDGVVRLEARALRTYADVPDVLASRLVMDGQYVYVLDATNCRIFRHVLNGADQVLQPDASSPLLLVRGQTVGSTVVGELVDIWWADAQGVRISSGLIAVSRDRVLVEIDRRWGATPIRVKGAEQWLDPRRFRGYMGNMYILDRGANQIWKYVPSADGYNNPPQPYFPSAQPRDTTLATDMAIDGSIYVLSSDGRVEKFTTGAKQPFEVKGLLDPLRSPTVIFAAPDPEAKWVYIAEPVASRIVVLAKTGEFVRQFKLSSGNLFGQVLDLYVDESGRRLFFVAGNGLYVCELP